MIATISAQVLLLMNQNLEADYPRSVVSPDFSCILNHTFVPSRSGLLVFLLFLLLSKRAVTHWLTMLCHFFAMLSTLLYDLVNVTLQSVLVTV